MLEFSPKLCKSVLRRTIAQTKKCTLPVYFEWKVNKLYNIDKLK